MSSFLDPLLVRVLSPEEVKLAGSSVQLYELLADFSYQSDSLGFTVTVPKGFHTDFASIPRAVWSWMDPEDPAICWASVIHDYLYSLSGELPGQHVISREQADGTLREAMAVCGATEFQQIAVYDAVRIGGGPYWDCHRE